jgi:glycosyltransferase involved in cell wall biosynthesis
VKVLYVSKSMVVAAYQDKLRELAAHADVTALIPERWSGKRPEQGTPEPARVETAATWFQGHNHFHLYRHAGHFLDAHKPDIVHIDEEPYSAVTSQLMRLCMRRGIPAVFFAWQNIRKHLPLPFPALRSYVYRHAAGAIAGTTQAAEVLRYGGYTRTIAVIPQLGVDASRFAPNPEAGARVRASIGAPKDDFIIGFGGRLVPEKGVHLLLEAASRLRSARLLFIGDGPERARLIRSADESRMAGRVHFAGAVASVDMPNWLAACDVVALPSISTRNWVEQFGRILIEAMACGVPVIGSSSGEIANVIGEEGGFVVPEGNSDALARSLLQFSGSKALRAEFGQSARNRVLAKYTHARVAADTVDYYRTLVPGQVRA